mmetsp:Transcript_69065/g.147781  ORF Transcript_69065/g.147781 Transcript_69065/m.147781 type:complete len:207 (-) Transcript_69065:984-1604(-)
MVFPAPASSFRQPASWRKSTANCTLKTLCITSLLRQMRQPVFIECTSTATSRSFCSTVQHASKATAFKVEVRILRKQSLNRSRSCANSAPSTPPSSPLRRLAAGAPKSPGSSSAPAAPPCGPPKSPPCAAAPCAAPSAAAPPKSPPTPTAPKRPGGGAPGRPRPPPKSGGAPPKSGGAPPKSGLTSPKSPRPCKRSAPAATPSGPS